MKNSLQKNVLIFDFDGVIADSFEVAYFAQKALNPRVTIEDYRNALNGNINEWQKKQVHTVEDFYKIYTPKILEEMKIFEGIDTLLCNLARQYILYIVSSNNKTVIDEYLISYTLTSCFQEILGNEVSHGKVEKIRSITSKYSPETQYLMVTDTTGDIIEAKEADVASIAVTWGFQKKESLAKGEPFAIADTQKELVAGIETFFQN